MDPFAFGAAADSCGGGRSLWRATLAADLDYRARALLMALLLGVGVSLPLVQASAMAAKMAVAAEMAMPGSDGCDGCGGGDLGGADTRSCLAICAGGALGLLPGEPADLPATFRASFHAAHVLCGGRTTTPDHGPPKILTLG